MLTWAKTMGIALEIAEFNKGALFVEIIAEVDLSSERNFSQGLYQDIQLLVFFFFLL